MQEYISLEDIDLQIIQNVYFNQTAITYDNKY